jgi:hypothetical protein
LKNLFSFIALLGLALVSGCKDAPGQWVEGVVHSKQPIAMPMSRRFACVGGIEINRSYRSGQRSHSTLYRPEHRWAKGATLTVDGKKYALKGKTGSPTFEISNAVWDWNKKKKPKVPHALMGWGHDDVLKSLNDPKITSSTFRVEAFERYTTCGSPLKVRAIIQGDMLELVDTQPANESNAITFMAILFGGFFIFFVLPIVLLIRWVLKRSKKKAGS